MYLSFIFPFCPKNVIIKSQFSKFFFTFGLEYIRILIQTWASNILKYLFVEDPVFCIYSHIHSRRFWVFEFIQIFIRTLFQISAHPCRMDVGNVPKFKPKTKSRHGTTREARGCVAEQARTQQATEGVQTPGQLVAVKARTTASSQESEAGRKSHETEQEAHTST